MATRIYDRELVCGCMLSSNGGGGLIPCPAMYDGYVEVPQEQLVKHVEAWEAFRESGEQALYEQECVANNS